MAVFQKFSILIIKEEFPIYMEIWEWKEVPKTDKN